MLFSFTEIGDRGFLEKMAERVKIVEKNDGFYTLKGYEAVAEGEITSAMEDYLEMICRLKRRAEHIKARDLAEMLHVQPSSVSKMVQQLALAGYLEKERYGVITLTEKGAKTGDYLLYRHEVLCRFLCSLNRSADELEQAEKIEHFLNRTTIENLNALTAYLDSLPPQISLAGKKGEKTEK